MSDLGDELRDTIDGAATPVTFDEVVGRTTADRPRRAPWQTILVAAVVVAALVVGAVVVANLGDGDDASKPHIAAPTVAVGDIDLAVLSTSFDEDGARGPIDPGVVDTVRSIPGVAGAQGAMQRFVDVVRTDTHARHGAARVGAVGDRDLVGGGRAARVQRRRSTAGRRRDRDQPVARRAVPGRRGRRARAQHRRDDGWRRREALPVGSGADAAGPSVRVDRRVVGVFTPAGGDVDDINLVVMRAEDLGTATNRPSFDRVDIVAAADVPIDELLDRVAAALPGGTMVVPPSVVGFDEQLRAELEIQRAYHWVLSPDRERGAARPSARPDDPESMARNQQTYDAEPVADREHRAAGLAGRVRRQRDRAGHLPRVLRRRAVGGRARPDDRRRRAHRRPVAALASAGMCELAAGGQRRVRGHRWTDGVGVHGAAERLERGRLRARSRPTRSACSRIRRRRSSSGSPWSTSGERLRAAIEAGVHADATARRQVSFNVSGARLLDATHAQILYSVIADGDPHLETPYPFVGNAVLVDGTWKVASRFACGLTALATLSCPAAAALPTTTTSSTTTSTTAPGRDDRPAVDRAADGRPGVGRGSDHARHCRPDVDRALVRPECRARGGGGGTGPRPPAPTGAAASTRTAGRATSPAPRARA